MTMLRWMLLIVGAAATIAGIVWTLQGLGYIGGSFMTGVTSWTVIGPITAAAGIALASAGLRRR
jgi:hypothetical protein